ncbi:hypothetical protein JTB14_020673 [Gonioctena quinquepunctata]|nr:hypothetical protein JTB14_020673 [Gonioctena quinquepunctata]
MNSKTYAEWNSEDETTMEEPTDRDGATENNSECTMKDNRDENEATSGQFRRSSRRESVLLQYANDYVVHAMIAEIHQADVAETCEEIEAREKSKDWSEAIEKELNAVMETNLGIILVAR